ncbi:MAG: septal ring lytic transglycosylase RlpA family protein [Candidatus Marinimicrobia bacterium]|nr:septal ring lytic transglycosylase RlpA family protein [Candidatus Neomarinimicrobiota bacterium]
MAKFVVLFLTFVVFLSCTPSPRFTSTPESTPSPRPANRAPSTSADREAPPKLSTNFRIGQMFVGIASYYGTKYHGRLTANGEVYDMYGITAAHKTLPFNTVVRVKNLKNNRELLVRINDRGPFIKGRILDLSYGAARKLDMITDGTGRVSIEIVELGDNLYAR